MIFWGKFIYVNLINFWFYVNYLFKGVYLNLFKVIYVKVKYIFKYIWGVMDKYLN